MASDVERIAGMLADRIHNHYGVTSSAANAKRLGIELAEQLAASGIGHVPTALHQAADALERQPKTEEWLYAADVIRARAEQAGGTA